ncbi:MAG: hypothetical protein LW720_07250 [Pirellula sp.]|jgi:hypothetical protein|nr:hypothetical protein [Pirellula sp.]
MFEWLNEEMNRIRTRKFHQVDGPASAELRRAVESCDMPVPTSYKQFVLQFGNAELYRNGSNYYVTVFASPNDSITDSGERYLHFGRTWTSNAFFKESLLSDGDESPVFEAFQESFRKTADTFEDWLKTKCDSARKRFKKKEWEAIEKGPSPFTDHEQAIVEARKQFRWRVVGVAPNEDLRFEIHNGSATTLPYLSVGIRGKLRPPKNSPLNGGAFLPIASIRPGETKVVEFDCYKKFIAPTDTEVFALPDPGPEDREQYWEFRT